MAVVVVSNVVVMVVAVAVIVAVVAVPAMPRSAATVVFLQTTRHLVEAFEFSLHLWLVVQMFAQAFWHSLIVGFVVVLLPTTLSAAPLQQGFALASRTLAALACPVVVGAARDVAQFAQTAWLAHRNTVHLPALHYCGTLAYPTTVAQAFQH